MKQFWHPGRGAPNSLVTRSRPGVAATATPSAPRHWQRWSIRLTMTPRPVSLRLPTGRCR